MSIPLGATGVYIIANIVNGKTYVGSAARSFKSRFSNHRSRLRRGVHHSRHLQNAWNKYGESSFVFLPVVLASPDECVSVEQEWIDGWRPAYNTARIAGSTLGTVLTQETREKLADAAKRSALAAKHRANLAETKRGKPLSPEHRAKIGAAGVGKTHSPETKAKMAAARKGYWLANVGRQLTDEHRAKIAASVAKTKARQKAERDGA